MWADNFLVVGQSEFHTLAPNTLNTFATRISVGAGDVIGFRIPSSLPCNRPATASYMRSSTFQDAQPGETLVTGPPVAGLQLDIAALLEPDADNDGFGDETQDGCPTDETTQGACAIPDTQIVKGLKDKTKKTATFEFSSPLTGASFECKLDDGPFAPCTSPHTLKVKRGKHTFQVRAVAKSQTDASSAIDDWKVKKKKK